MPVKSLNSAVRKWPDRNKVIEEAGNWAKKLARGNKSVKNIYIFGSAADAKKWGVGSDIDILVELKESSTPFISRSPALNPSNIPVPAEILIYTTRELERMRKEKRRFIQEFDRNSIRLFPGSDKNKGKT